METTQLDKLKLKIPYDVNIFVSDANYVLVLNDLLTDIKWIALEILFPYEDYSTYELPIKYNNWQLRACVELYNLADKQGIINYAENGISWSKKIDGLSSSLMNSLIPKVGVPKKVVVEDV